MNDALRFGEGKKNVLYSLFFVEIAVISNFNMQAVTSRSLNFYLGEPPLAAAAGPKWGKRRRRPQICRRTCLRVTSGHAYTRRFVSNANRSHFFVPWRINNDVLANCF